MMKCQAHAWTPAALMRSVWRRQRLAATPMLGSRDEGAAFIAEFEAERLPKSRLTHEAHLVAGYWYVWWHGASGPWPSYVPGSVDTTNP